MFVNFGSVLTEITVKPPTIDDMEQLVDKNALTIIIITNNVPRPTTMKFC